MTAPAGTEKPPASPAAEGEQKKETPQSGSTSPFSGLSAEEKERLLLQQAETIRNNARKQAELDAKLKALEDKVNAPPPPSPAELQQTNKEFFTAPATMTREIVKEELKETIKPLIDFKEEVQAQTQYERIKAQFKNNPKFKDFLTNPNVEATVDQLMESNPKTEQALYGVLLSLRGAIEIGDIPVPEGFKVGGGEAKPKVDVTVPPHLRPSAPPLPENEGKKGEPVRELTENERRLMREMSIKSAEEYLAWIDENATEVATSEIGIKKEEKKK